MSPDPGSRNPADGRLAPDGRPAPGQRRLPDILDDETTGPPPGPMRQRESSRLTSQRPSVPPIPVPGGNDFAPPAREQVERLPRPNSPPRVERAPDVELAPASEAEITTGERPMNRRLTPTPSEFADTDPPAPMLPRDDTSASVQVKDSPPGDTDENAPAAEPKVEVVNDEDEEIPPSPEIAKRFDVVLQLGRGGMAVVYLCRDPQQKGKIVAVKDIRTEMKPGLRMMERVEHEVMLLKTLDHPGIVKVYDLLKFPRGSAIVMEYIDGLPLDHELGRGRRLTWDFGVRVLREIGAALGYAHSKGVIHRDLKPDNILYSERHNVMKLVDFGLARLYGDEVDISMTRTGMVVGTPHYMSPEQVSGKQLDQRSDVYSFGATLYYLITGKRHIEATNVMDILEQQRSSTILPPTHINRHIPAWFAYILGKMMELDPAQRYPTMAAVLDDLKLAERDPDNFVLNNPRGPVKRFGIHPLVPIPPEPVPTVTATDQPAPPAGMATATDNARHSTEPELPAAGAPASQPSATREFLPVAAAPRPASGDTAIEIGRQQESAKLSELAGLVREMSGRLEKAEKDRVSALTMFLIVLLSALIACGTLVGVLVWAYQSGKIPALLK
ncbi:MAG: protein kinase [Planctomycetes bacterium]|nr:protein kinase [Planctomycetota bacterium]